MKEHYTDFRFEYKGFGIHDSWCQVEVWTHKDKYLVILTEPGTESSGTSVTNACEDIATKLFNQPGVFRNGASEKNIIWVEHYPERGGFPPTYDSIKFEYDQVKKTYGNPQWTHIGDALTEEQMKELLNGIIR